MTGGDDRDQPAGAGAPDGSGSAQAGAADDVLAAGRKPARLRALLQEALAIVDAACAPPLARGPRKPRRPTSPVVRAAKDVQRFMQTCSTPEPGWAIQAGPLYEVYLAWCAAVVVEPATATAFGFCLGDLGYKKRGGGSVLYLNVRLTPAGRDLGRAIGGHPPDFYVGEGTLEG